MIQEIINKYDLKNYEKNTTTKGKQLNRKISEKI